MSYIGDFSAGAIFDFKFSTQKGDGTPATLSGSPVVSIYKSNATGTETTTGVTLSVDFDGKTGLNNVHIDTADAFYATGNDFAVIITTGTVDSISVIGRVVAEFSIEHRSVGSGTAPSAATVAAAVWDRLLTAITTADSIGKLLKDDIDATISSRASQASVDTIDDFLDTEIAAIKAKTDNLPSDPADASDIAASFATVGSKLDTIDDFLDTEIAAIKAKTDLLPGDAVPTGAVVTDGTNSAVSFKTDLTGVANNYYKDMWCRLTSGAMAKQVKRVTASNGTTGFITVSGGYTGIPAPGVTLELENR